MAEFFMRLRQVLKFRPKVLYIFGKLLART